MCYTFNINLFFGGIFLKISLPSDVNFIINKLESAGYEAYIVGGCVRDLILNLTPNDWDITTSAKPDTIKELFCDYRLMDSGEKHGTIGVIINHSIYEITTFRIEGEYEDFRHPDSDKPQRSAGAYTVSVFLSRYATR